MKGLLHKSGNIELSKTYKLGVINMKKIALIFIVFTVLTIIMTESIQADELGKRWEDAFEKELKNAVLMYEKGRERYDCIGRYIPISFS